MVQEDYLRCHEYEGQGAHTSETGFSAFYQEESQRYFFALLDATGKVLLKSEGYPQQAARENGIQSVIKNRSNSDFYSVKSYENGRYYISLRAGNHREIARSCSFLTEVEAMAELPYVSGEKSRIVAAAATTQTAGEKATIITVKQGVTETTVSDEKTIVVSVKQGQTTSSAGDSSMVEKSVIKGETTTTVGSGASTIETTFKQGETITTSGGDSSMVATTFKQGETITTVGGGSSIVGTTFKQGETITTVGSSSMVETTVTQGKTITTAGDASMIVGTTYRQGETITTRVAAPVIEVDAPIIEVTPVVEEIVAPIVEEVAVVTPVVEAIVAPVVTPVLQTEVEDDYLPCREYEGRTINDKVNNVALFKHDNGQYYFAIYDAQGKVRLRSEGFRTAPYRDKELSGALKNLNNNDLYSIIRRGNYSLSVLKDPTGREVGRSCLEKDEPVVVAPPPVEVIAPVAAVVAAVVVAAAPEPPPPLVVAPDVEDDYLSCKEYEGHKINDKVNNVSLFKNDNGQYYFAIYHKDGKVRLRSEGFKTAQNRDKELSGALKNLNNKDMYSTIRKGNYWMAVLKDSTGREVGRGCLEKEEPVVVPPVAVAAAVAAIAATVVEIPKVEPKKVVVETPKVEIPKAIIEIPKAIIETPKAVFEAPIVEEAATGGFKWWWLLPLLAILGLGWWFSKGCNKEEVVTPTVAAVSIDTVKTVVAAPIVAAPVGCPACASGSDPIFTSICDNPKKLSRLGTNPEFGNSHDLSPTQFYEKLKKAHANNDVDKEFLDRVFKAMGYTGFADAKADQFSAVVIPVGTSGRLGYSKAHKTGCYTLPDDEYHRKAFHIKAANGCDLHFMKTCGNHFFFCNK